MERGIAVFQPDSLKLPDALDRIQKTGADAMVVAAYGLILPPAVLHATSGGALNIHASLLPRWRGAAPIQRALLAGDAETGISIMQMDAGLDTGPLLSQQALPVHDDDDAGTLHEKLAALGARMLIQTLEALSSGEIIPKPQPATGATYANKIDKAEAAIDWSRPAIEIERKIRAFRPSPGASTEFAGMPLKIWRAHARDEAGSPGRILGTREDTVLVGCGQGVLAVQELQRAGARRLSAADFLRGQSLPAGARLG
jgi:methionyl-tRNA formyltransferase